MNLNYVLYVAPLILGMLSGFASNLSGAGSKIPARPPGVVFGIVWFMLYLLIGIAWVEARKVNQLESDILFLILTVALVIWPFMYNISSKVALYVLLVILLITIIVVGYSWITSKIAGYLISPLLAWIIFAMLLNFTEVNMQDARRNK